MEDGPLPGRHRTHLRLTLGTARVRTSDERRCVRERCGRVSGYVSAWGSDVCVSDHGQQGLLGLVFRYIVEDCDILRQDIIADLERGHPLPRVFLTIGV